MKDWTTKDLRKAAFAVGLGFTVGREVAYTIGSVSGYFMLKALKHRAENGDEAAQEIYRLYKSKAGGHSQENGKNEPKMKIGFHCE